MIRIQRWLLIWEARDVPGLPNARYWCPCSFMQLSLFADTGKSCRDCRSKWVCLHGEWMCCRWIIGFSLTVILFTFCPFFLNVLLIKLLFITPYCHTPSVQRHSTANFLRVPSKLQINQISCRLSCLAGSHSWVCCSWLHKLMLRMCLDRPFRWDVCGYLWKFTST